jgi:hypothetical protein
MPCFYKNREQEGKIVPVLWVGTTWSREDIKKGCQRVNIVQLLYIHMYANGKIRPIKISPGMGGRDDKGE